MSKGLKYTFLAHAVVATIMGLGLFLIPKTLADAVNWTPSDPSMARGYGALLLAVAISSWLGYAAKEWVQVRIVVRTENAITALGFVASLYSVLFDKGPTFLWATVAITAIFGVLFVFYGKVFKTQSVPAPQRVS